MSAVPRVASTGGPPGRTRTRREVDLPRGAAEARRPAVIQVVQTIDKGGLEWVAVDLACHLLARGIRPVLVGLEAGGVLEPRLASAGIQYYVLGGIRYRDTRFHWKLARIFRRERPHAIHTHHYSALLSSVIAAKVAGVPRIVHTEHGFRYLEERPRHRPVLRWISRASDAFVLVARAMEPFYTQLGIDPRRLHVIPNGVALDRYVRREPVPSLRQRLGLPEGILIGTAGRFAWEKNYPLLIRAFARARRQRPDVYLVMAGDGECRAEYEALAAACGLGDAVRFLGWRTDIPELVGALDLFVLCSWSEMLPVAVLEAMASEVPVVATAVGDLGQIIRHGSTGFLVPPGDEDALAAQLQRLIDDPSVRRAVGTAGRRSLANRYDHDSMVTRYVREYGL